MLPKLAHLFGVVFLVNFSLQWEVVKKVQDGKKMVRLDGQKTSVVVKKVFVTLVDGAYKYNKKKIMGRRENGHYRVQFVCLECAKIGVFLSAYCTVTVEDPDLEEADVYEADKLPTPEQHSCQPHGVEDLVEKFKKALRDGVHENPVRPLPELFETTR